MIPGSWRESEGRSLREGERERDGPRGRFFDVCFFFFLFLLHVRVLWSVMVPVKEEKKL